MSVGSAAVTSGFGVGCCLGRSGFVASFSRSSVLVKFSLCADGSFGVLSSASSELVVNFGGGSVLGFGFGGGSFSCMSGILSVGSGSLIYDFLCLCCGRRSVSSVLGLCHFSLGCDPLSFIDLLVGACDCLSVVGGGCSFSSLGECVILMSSVGVHELAGVRHSVCFGEMFSFSVGISSSSCGGLFILVLGMSVGSCGVGNLFCLKSAVFGVASETETCSFCDFLSGETERSNMAGTGGGCVSCLGDHLLCSCVSAGVKLSRVSGGCCGGGFVV